MRAGLSRDDIARWLVAQVADLLDIVPAEIDIEQAFTYYGLSSADGALLAGDLEDWLGCSLPASVAWEYPTISSLAEYLSTLVLGTETGTAAGRIVGASAEAELGDHPLSYNQQALWYLYRLAPESSAYHIVYAGLVRSAVDADALRRALGRLVSRHAVLRTTYPVVGGVPVQRVHAALDVPLVEEDASAWSDATLRARLGAAAQAPFSLGDQAPMRMILYHAPQPTLLLAVHHIAADLWSLAVMVRDLGALYVAEVEGRSAGLAPLQLCYADFARWQAEMLGGAEGERLWTYWHGQLQRDVAPLQLPIDHPRPAVQTFAGGSVAFRVPAPLARGLAAVAQSHGVTLYVTLLAAFQVLLHRYTGQDEFLIGSPTAGRQRRELAPVLGYFVNPVVIRAALSGEPSFSTVLAGVRQSVRGAIDHQEYPFSLLVQRLRPVRDASRSPLFQVMFVWQQTTLPDESELAPFAVGEPGSRVRLGALELEALPLPEHGAQFDVTLAMADAGDELVGSLLYNTDLFEQPTIERMVAHFLTVLQEVAADSAQPISAFSLLTPTEQARMLVEWNATSIDYGNEPLLPGLFEAQVVRTPDALAVVAAAGQLSYEALNRRANQLAYALRRRGIGPDTCVAVCMERSPEMLVALLGVLKAGGAYVPLDPEYPEQRLAFMLAESRAPVLLTQERLVPALPPADLEILCIDRDAAMWAGESDTNPVSNLTPDALIYVMFTSGSTGTPKGVMIPHAGIRNRLLWMQEISPLSGADRLLQKTPFTWDVSALELFWPLVTGACLVLARPLGHRDADYIAELILEQRVTIAHFVPSMLRAFLERPRLPRHGTLRRVLCAGEELPADVQHRFFAQIDAELYNLYGPTETSIDSAAWRCVPDAAARTVPIGRPISNTQLYILDAGLQPVPVGVVGELHIGGAGLARGYLNRPDLTAEKFIANPFSASLGARLYKTGDLCRFRPDGVIEFLGRRDDQVKVRGVRIELGEIEAALVTHPEVREAAVAAAGDADGGTTLVAYVVPEDGVALAGPALRGWLKGKLPDSMLPAVFVRLDALPRMPNGKVNRRDLPALGTRRPDVEATFVGPRTPLETQLTQLWQGVLGLEQVGVHDNFFELGGDSLKAVILVARVSIALQRDVPVTSLLLSPTIEALAESLGAAPFTAVGGAPAEKPPARGHGISAPHAVVERRSLLGLYAAGELQSVDAAAIAYFPAAMLAHIGVSADTVRREWCDGLPVFGGVWTTPWGRIGLVLLPRFDFEVYADEALLLRELRAAVEMSGRIGATTVALTGLLPSATDYGRALAVALQGRPGPALTTGHAATAAAMVLNVQRLLAEAARPLSGERVACLGVGSIGRATVELLLGALPHPSEILLVDVPARRERLEALRDTLAGVGGFGGSIDVLPAHGGVPPQVYESTLIIGATNAPGILDVERLPSGVLLVDDSAPHCFVSADALRRFRARQDILFTEGGIVRAPVPLGHVRYVPRAVADALVERALPSWAAVDPCQITACVLSSVLSARFAQLAPGRLGEPDAEAARASLAALAELGLRAPALQCEDEQLDPDCVRRFRAQWGGNDGRPGAKRDDHSPAGDPVHEDRSPHPVSGRGSGG